MKNQKELVITLEKALKFSGFSSIVITKNESNMYLIECKKIYNYKIYAFLRSIGKSGWSNKPEIRRVQIAAFDVDRLIPSGDQHTCMIIGIQELLDKDIFVVWNVYNYGLHKTNRSCYVKVTNLFKGFLQGYFSTTDSNQKIWISDSYNIDKLLNEYLNFNKSSLGDMM
ncbi:MAG: hypothetical protein RBQ97_09880 [Acholeplasma sp.]|nr:hypothetical protein [Acholeplasma sp.]